MQHVHGRIDKAATVAQFGRARDGSAGVSGA